MSKAKAIRRTVLAAAAGMILLAAVAAAQPAAPDAPGGAAETKIQSTPRMSLWELLMKGGYFMIPIGLCSLMGLALIVERAISLRRGAIIPRGFLEGLKRAFQGARDDRRAGLEYCRQNDCPMARVAAAGIRKLHKPEQSVEAAIEDAGANEVAKLRRNLVMLVGISAVAPMLGLLGTVWGMIQAFQVASLQGLGKAESLAKGIYEALVTTFGGLTVAIPILIFYYYFRSKIERIVSQMNDVSVEFLDHYVEEADPAEASSD